MSKLTTLFSVVFFTLLFIACTEDSDLVNPQDDRDLFLGTWNVNETCNRGAYQITITKDPTNSSQVIINNFWLIGPNEKAPYAIVAGSNIVIPQQNIYNNEKTLVKGSGTLDKDIIEWEYTVNDGADLYTCTATYEKI
ncbi:MAG: hypothetical protein DRH89_07970 [Candidatus Cloacimonadota bacterium]|nr:MAG: hypothetical protein DRH89_07970 [Candidatus Cloacimonadota bacterium]